MLSKDLLGKKIEDIKTDIEITVLPTCQDKFSVVWYGAYDINSKHLVYWICVQTDNQKNKLLGNENLKARLLNLLKKHNYPEPARKYVIIGFESQETVDRESNGNWWHHFK